MRMAGPDVVLFVVGALLFGGAGYAIYSEGSGLRGASSALGVFEVTYATAQREVGSEAIEVRDGSVVFDVTDANVASVVVTIDCSDGAAGNALAFTLEVTVTGPNGLASEASGTCGTPIEVEVPVAEAPTRNTVAGSTEEEARENLPVSENATAAQGAWTVTLTGDRAAGPGPALPVPIPDPTATATLKVAVWEPSFAPVQR